jgi:hypothetical protein
MQGLIHGEKRKNNNNTQNLETYVKFLKLERMIMKTSCVSEMTVRDDQRRLMITSRLGFEGFSFWSSDRVEREE